MKSHKSIAILMIVVTGIISFWLYPGINKADTARYERVYENTSVKNVGSLPEKSDTAIRSLGIRKPEYLKQELVLLGGIEELEVEMFSRATHFHEPPIPELDLSIFRDLPEIDDNVIVADDTICLEVASSASDVNAMVE